MVNIFFNGRLGADAEIKTSASGNKYVHMRIATDDYVKGERTTVWFNVVYHGDRALKVAEYLKKGSLVLISGIESVSTYQNKSGETAISRDVIANRVDFVQTQKSEEQQNSQTATNAEAVSTGTFTPKAKGEKPKAEPQVVTTSSTELDDLPF